MKIHAKQPPKHPVLNKIVTVFVLIMITAVVVCFGSILATKYIYHQPASLFGYRMVKILTDSMEPAIMTNSYILVKRIDGLDVKEGDFVLYLPEDENWLGKGVTITHECIEGPHIDPETGHMVITTQGRKAGATPDAPVPVENVQSVYVATIGDSGFMDFLTSKWGIVVLIALPCLAGVVLQIVTMVRAIKDNPDEDKVKKAVEEIEEERKEKLKKDAIESFMAQQSVLEFLAKQKEVGSPGVEGAKPNDAPKPPAANAASTAKTEASKPAASAAPVLPQSVLDFIAQQKAAAEQQKKDKDQ